MENWEEIMLCDIESTERKKVGVNKLTLASKRRA
jgi:hypothetical protein